MTSDHAHGCPVIESAAADNDNLPKWDLGRLYNTINDPRIESDLVATQKMVKHFVRLRSRVTELTANELKEAIYELEAIHKKSAGIMSLASLSKAVDQLDCDKAAFYQRVTEAMTDISKECQFFTLELNDIEDLSPCYDNDNGLIIYKPWLDRVRRFKPHQLSLESENILHDKSITSSDAWVRLFDETQASLTYNVRGNEVSFSQAAHQLINSDESIRRDAAKAISETLGKNSRLLSLIMNNIIKDKATDDKLRKFARPISSRNLDNSIDDDIVDLLINTVKANYPNIAHRYYKIKARYLNKKVLNYWDRNAPLRDDSSVYTWERAKELVLGAYENFSPEMARLARVFFDRDAIDAPVSQAKSHGAFCHGCAPGETPFIMVNFQGNIQDVYTLAHELGHGVHYMLSSGNPILLYHVPLTFAETASVFGEQLLFRSLFAKERDKTERFILLANMIESMINTIVRQVAFCEFERISHDKRADGELSAEEINKIWIRTQSESLGSGIELTEEYGPYWSMVPHFIHTPFYVYAYAFGACLVNSLYAIYLKEGESFIPKYEQLLRIGGAVSPEVMKRDFGLDLHDPAFWQGGLDIVSKMIDELEALV